ncbi:MAG: chloride channel protein, partial [Elusimicrobia bacterium CG08_land_8_20_14_0_20_59_10]
NSETAFLLLFSILVGLGTGFGAVAFRWLIASVQKLFFEDGRALLHFMGDYYVILLPAAGGLVVGLLIYHFAKEAKGHGVPEVMLAVANEGGRIRPRVVLVKALASAVCIGSGGSAGREGPIVQIGSAFGSTIGQVFNLNEDKIKILIACGAAGGIAATFNAPLAGMFFALEVILMAYGPKHISSVVLSAVTATVVSRHFLGNFPAFVIPSYQMSSAWEIPLYFIFGFLAALTALAFIKVLYKTEDVVDLVKMPAYLKPVLGGLVIGSIGLFFPQIFGVGYGSIENALRGELIAQTAVLLVFLKIMATSVTLGSGGSGGVFAPSLFIGAMLGSAYGLLTQFLVPAVAIHPGACALVGMGAVFAGAAQAPLSAIMILFEMTNDYRIILPLMITCIISTVVVGRLSRDSIYTLKLRRRGIDIQKPKGQDLMETIKIADAMRTAVVTVKETDTIGSAGLKIKSTHYRGFPVLDPENRLTGIITRQDINKAMAEGRSGDAAREIMTRDVIVCYPDEVLRSALEKLGKKDIGRIPVVERKNSGHLIGLIDRKSIISSYNKAFTKSD